MCTLEDFAELKKRVIDHHISQVTENKSNGSEILVDVLGEKIVLESKLLFIQPAIYLASVLFFAYLTQRELSYTAMILLVGLCAIFLSVRKVFLRAAVATFDNESNSLTISYKLNSLGQRCISFSQISRVFSVQHWSEFGFFQEIKVQSKDGMVFVVGYTRSNDFSYLITRLLNKTINQKPRE